MYVCFKNVAAALGTAVLDLASGYVWHLQLFIYLHINPISDGETFQDFLVQLPNAARHSAHIWWLFLNAHCAHLSKKKKMPGQVRSGNQSGFVDPTSEKFANTSELEFFTKLFPLIKSSKQYLQYVSFVYLRIFDLWPEVRSESWPLHCKPMEKYWNATCTSSKRVKTTQFFKNYDKLSYL